MLENKTTYPTVGAASAAIAGLALAASLLLTPSAALADNECGLTAPSDNGALADSYNCSEASYAGGVTYTADGNLTIDFDRDTTTTIGGTGITLTGDGSEDITFDSNDPTTTIRSLSGMDGNLLGITTVDGNILVTTSVMDGDTSNAENVDRAIFAQSTGTGNIDITTTGNVDARGSNPATSVGIEAIANGGDITITSGARTEGNQYGIRAETSGAGTLDIVVNDLVSPDITNGVAAIDATTGTGQLSIAISASGDVRGGIIANAGGDASIDVASGTQVLGGLNLTVAGETTINNNGRMSDGINAAGGSLVLNNNGQIDDFLDFSNLDDGYTFNNNAGGVWLPDEGTVLGAGDLLNDGGTIRFTSFTRGNYISAIGTNFTGSGDSVLEINAILDGAGQLSCTSPTIAACLDLSGGSTAGLTSIRFLATENPDPLDVPLAPPINPGIVVVDVGGGTSSADHFVLDSGSTGYAVDSRYGPILVTGDLFDYTLLYNSDNQQHVLTSVPRREGFEYVSFIQESLSIWHTTTDAVVGRQADLQEGGARGGWARIVRSGVDRDARPTLITHGNTFVYDNDYSLDTTAFVAGYDMTFSDNHVIGLHGGLMSADLEYDHSQTRDEAKGAMAGMYAGWWNDMGLTLDGALNINFVSIEHKMPDYENSETNAISYGLRVEAGWRLPIGESFYVQPLASAAYAQSNLERLDLRFYDATFENDESMRAALGVRLGGDMDLSSERFSSVKYWLTARAWDESAGDDAQVRFKTESDPLIIEDDLSGSFEEVGLGVSLTSPDEKLSVFLSGNGQFGDETDSLDVTVGARLYW